MGPDVLKQLPEDRHAFAAGAKRNFARIKDEVMMIKPGEDIIGDALTHAIISFAYPEWRPASDHLPDKAVDTRKRLLGRLTADKSRIIGYHLPFPGIGVVEQKGAAFAFRPQA